MRRTSCRNAQQRSRRDVAATSDRLTTTPKSTDTAHQRLITFRATRRAWPLAMSGQVSVSQAGVASDTIWSWCRCPLLPVRPDCSRAAAEPPDQAGSTIRYVNGTCGRWPGGPPAKWTVNPTPGERSTQRSCRGPGSPTSVTLMWLDAVVAGFATTAVF